MSNIPAGSIFNPGGYPEKSLVVRYPYFQNLLDKIIKANDQIIEIRGASRTGKSVMVERCFRDNALSHFRRITISGGSIENLHSFKLLLYSNLKEDNTQNQNETFVEPDIPEIINPVTERNNNQQPIVPDIEIFARLRDEPTALIIEDFHWVPESARTHIIRMLKALMEQARSKGHPSLRIIVIMIPTKSIHTGNIWNELSAERVIPFSIPLWQPQELQKIAVVKFAQAGASVIGLRNMAAECFGLPSTMQAFCLEYCDTYHQGLVPGGNELVQLNDTNLPPIFQKIADKNWTMGLEAVYDKLTTGDALLDDTMYQRYDGKLGNLNQLILQSLVHRPPVTERFAPQFEDNIEYILQTIMYRILEVVGPISRNQITTQIVTSGLAKMSSYLKKEYDLSLTRKESSGSIDPILEFTENSVVPTLNVYTPSFLMALRHTSKVEKKWFRS